MTVPALRKISDQQELEKILEFFFPAKSKVVQNHLKREKNGKKIFCLMADQKYLEKFRRSVPENSSKIMFSPSN